METVIKWINIKDGKPVGFGWYMTVCMPDNYIDFSERSKMNDWISKYGIDKTWFNNGEFWDRDRSVLNPKVITAKIIYWAKIPLVPML